MRKVAIVTGGCRGIGYGISTALAKAGFDLLAAGRRPEAECQEALEALRACGGKVAYAVCDVADRAHREALVAFAKTEFGRLDVHVNNAGVAPKTRNDLLDATEESYDFVMTTNLKGPYFLTQAVARWMVEQKKADPAYQGRIVNISSISATVVSVNRGEYCLSKAGVSMATQLWAARLAEFGIGVYEVRPGVIATDMTSGVKAKYDQVIAEGGIPLRRWGFPEDIGKAVSAIATGAFPYSTGQVFLVDGGMGIQTL
ncbi:MAG: 3-ketoacyl-ACP reductase [Kiritimatiellia bacterium]|jgi:3-oxoacyl-[acyl-carrier protein] reductase